MIVVKEEAWGMIAYAGSYQAVVTRSETPGERNPILVYPFWDGNHVLGLVSYRLKFNLYFTETAQIEDESEHSKQFYSR